MAAQQEHLQASILDKLIDYEPDKAVESSLSRAANLRQIEQSVIRDIESLLNTKRTIITPPPICKEVSRSLYTYGLKDFSAENPRNSAVMQKIRREIDQIITLFEPRIKNAMVQIDLREKSRHLHFRVVGTLVVDPISEPIVFDTRFDTNKGEYFISR